MISAAFAVTGMTCGHCAAAVTEELRALPGVRSVSVDVDSGQVRLTADRMIDSSEIDTAVALAGYQVADQVLR